MSSTLLPVLVQTRDDQPTSLFSNGCFSIQVQAEHHRLELDPGRDKLGSVQYCLLGRTNENRPPVQLFWLVSLHQPVPETQPKRFSASSIIFLCSTPSLSSQSCTFTKEREGKGKQKRRATLFFFCNCVIKTLPYMCSSCLFSSFTYYISSFVLPSCCCLLQATVL